MMERRFCIEPTPDYPSMHASSVCELEDGRLLACCYAGMREGSPDSVVLGTRFDMKQGRWGKPAVWVDVPRRAPANPRVFLGPRSGEVWLVVGINYGRWCSGDTYLFFKRSLDGGESWTDLELLVDTKGLLGRNKPCHGNGVWILPVEWERRWSAAFLRSTDNGESWEIVGDLGHAAGAHLIQPAVVRLGDGRLLAYMRSQEGYIYWSESRDLGKTWTAPMPTPLPNNNSGIDMIRLRSGLLALAYNPVGLSAAPPELDERWPERMPVEFDRWGERSPLVVSFSPDDGTSWPWSLTLESGPGEYSYPAVIQGRDGTLHITYTYRRAAIRHIAIAEAEVARICKA